MYNQYQNQPQPLVTDPTQQVQPMVNVQVGNPPFLPQIPVPGELQPYYKLIVSLLLIEVQNKATVNAARMYAFNLMAMNGFQTQEFANLTLRAVQLIDAVLRTTNNIGIEAAIQELIPDLVGKYCLAMVGDTTDLMQFLDPNTAQHVNSAIQGMAMIMQKIASVNQQSQMQTMIGGRLTGNFPGNAGQAYQASGHYQARNPLGSAAGGGGNAAAALFEAGARTNNTNNQGGVYHEPTGHVSRFKRQMQRKADERDEEIRNYNATYKPVNVAGSNQVDRVAKRTYSMNSTAPAVQAVDPTPATPVKPLQTQVIQTREENLVWKPSETQPYLPIFDFTKFKMELKRLGDEVIGVVQPLTQEERDKMNPEDHAMTRVPLPRYDATAIEKPEEQVTDRDFIVPKFELTFRPNTVLELDSGIASIMSGMRYAISKGEKVRAAARCTPAILLDVISIEKKDTAKLHNEIIAGLSACDSFERAQALLDVIHDSPEDRLFFNRINNLLTNELNSILTMNIGNLWMDSFFTDWQAAAAEIVKKRGPAVSQAFMSKQRQFFEQFALSLSDANMETNTAFLREEYVEDIGENPEQWDCDFVVIPWQTSITHLSMASYELNISLRPGNTGTLTEQTTPELWSLADQILNYSEFMPARRHYIVTDDGIKFTLTRGYLKSDAYLIRRVKEVF